LHLGSYKLTEITRDRIEQIRTAKKEKASSTTANRYLALIRSVLRAARDDWEWIDRISRIRLYPEPKKRIRFLTRDEASRLINELPPHLAELTAFTLATGLRQSNASKLRWDQVDRSLGVAWIHPDQSKSRNAIGIPLNSDAMSILEHRFREHETYVFTYNGAPVSRTSTKAWYNALKRANIYNFRWHDLRHTWASWHVQSGTSLQELQELGGWANLDMVLKYAHLNSANLKSAANRLNGSIPISSL
jgi:integrase